VEATQPKELAGRLKTDNDMGSFSIFLLNLRRRRIKKKRLGEKSTRCRVATLPLFFFSGPEIAARLPEKSW